MKAYMCKQRGIRLIKLPMKGTELDYANSLKKAFQSVHIFISSDTEEDVEIIKIHLKDGGTANERENLSSILK